MTFRGHSGAVTALEFSADGKILVSGDFDLMMKPGHPKFCSVRLWDVETGRQTAVLSADSFQTNLGIWRVALSRDGQVFAGSGSGNSLSDPLLMWDAHTGVQTGSFPLNANRTFAFSPDRRQVLTGGMAYRIPDGTVAPGTGNCARLWSIDGGKLLRMFEGHSGGVTAVAFSADAKRVATGSMDHTVRLWDAETGTELASHRSHLNLPAVLAFSADGRRLMSASMSEILSWDTQSNALLSTLKGQFAVPFGNKACVACSPNGRFALSGSPFAFSDPPNQRTSRPVGESQVQLWDLDEQRVVHVFRGHRAVIWSVAFSPDGKFAVSGSGDPNSALADVPGQDVSIRLWKLPVSINAGAQPAEAPIARALEHVSGALGVTEGELLVMRGHSGAVTAVNFSDDGNSLVSGSQGKEADVRIWNAATGEQTQLCRTTIYGVTTVAFQVGDREVLAAGQRSPISRWNAATGASVGQYDVPNLTGAIAFLEDGKQALSIGLPVENPANELASRTASRGVCRWELGTKEQTTSGTKLLGTLKGHTEGVSAVAYSSALNQVATASSDLTIRLWDVDTATEIRRLETPLGLSTFLAFSADGTRLLSASMNRQALVWDLRTGTRIVTLEGTFALPSHFRNCVAFSPNGRHVLSGNPSEHRSTDRRTVPAGDSHLRLWDVDKGRIVHVFKGHQSVIWSVAFSRDGRFALSGSGDPEADPADVPGNDGTVRLWKLPDYVRENPPPSQSARSAGI